MARYGALFSGSHGNATYIGMQRRGLLVDAGVSAKRLREALIQRDISPEDIAGILITHEHRDHIAGLHMMTKQYGLPVYASAGTLQALLTADAIDPRSPLIPLADAVPTPIGDLLVTPFRTPHDAKESMGFCIEMPDERRVAVATDMGCMLPAVAAVLATCDLVHIESNHDEEMVRTGSYPLYLKERILSHNGHLSNTACAETIAALAQAGVTRFTLAHLSEQNNTPELAWKAAYTALTTAGFAAERDFMLQVASPVPATPLTVF